MDVLNPHIRTADAVLPTAANDACARVPVMRPAQTYRRVALHNAGVRSQAAALLVALAFCTFWVGVRAAAPEEISAVRAQLAQSQDGAAVARLDAALVDARPSLLRLHWMRLTLS